MATQCPIDVIAMPPVHQSSIQCGNLIFGITGCVVLGICLWLNMTPTRQQMQWTVEAVPTTSMAQQTSRSAAQLRRSNAGRLWNRAETVPEVGERPSASMSGVFVGEAKGSKVTTLASLAALGLIFGTITAWRQRWQATSSAPWAMAVATGVEVQDKSIPQGEEWEIDFCSRPLVDNRGKRVWEIMVCNPKRTFEYTEYIPNNKVNSTTLKGVVKNLLAKQGAEAPKVVRFFRGQMITIISKAFEDLKLKAVPSRRCFTLMNWLDERLTTVYQQDPRFDANISLSGSLRGPIEAPPNRLPDALRGETWEFVELPLSAVKKEAELVGKATPFGSSFDFDAAGCGDMDPNTMIPGVAVFSRRSKPLAAWTSGLELTAITSDEKYGCLVLETGFSDKWYYGGWTDSSLAKEGSIWEQAKQKSRGLHFLAVQQNDEADNTDGFWLLLKRDPPQV